MRDSIARLLTATTIPAATAYRAAKFSKAIITELQDLEEARMKLVKKYGVLNKEDKLEVPESNYEEFNKEFDAVQAVEVEIPVVKLTIEELKSAGLSILDFSNLDFLIKG